MNDVVLKVENLHKQYRLGVVGSGTLKDDLQRFWARMRGKEDPLSRVGETNQLNSAGGDYVWALKDVSFEVKRGEVLGIIGKNGAGKSTLLKILSKVTCPTKGNIYVDGRIASLLEVGTGFHPELTGRENIFLNGAILGMKRREIRSKLDEIVDFAGVEKYLYTPVKRYSSGMYVRLAFAVAAHLEPEILIVDEVLAVGDVEFQKKAIGKMQDVSKGQGRTVLFVSHNMGAVQKLCDRGLILENGLFNFIGKVSDSVERYLSRSSGKICLDNYVNRNDKDESVRLKEVHAYQQVGLNSFDPSLDIHIDIIFENLLNQQRLAVGVQVYTQSDIPVFSSVNWKSAILGIDEFGDTNLSKGNYKSKCIIPNTFLNEGTYFINIVILRNHTDIVLFEEKAISMEIVNNGYMRDQYHDNWLGIVRPRIMWKTSKTNLSSD